MPFTFADSPLSAQLLPYKKIADITRAMMEAARAQNWDDALEFGYQYCDAVEALRQHDHAVSHPLSESERTIKRDLLIHILENDAATRQLASPQIGRLGVLLGRLKRQQSLLHAYGSEHTHTSTEAPNS